MVNELNVCLGRADYTSDKVWPKTIWLGILDSNQGFLIQSQASYHWTNPQTDRHSSIHVFMGQSIEVNPKLNIETTCLMMVINSGVSCDTRQGASP